MTKDNEPYVTGYDRVEIPAPRPDMTELIEAVARAMDDADPVHPAPGAYSWKHNRKRAQAALTAITDAGYRIVKDEPVAWEYKQTPGTRIAAPRVIIEREPWLNFDPFIWIETPLYAAPGDEK